MRRTKTIRPASFSLANLPAYLTTFFSYWDLLLTLSLHRVKVRYKQSVLGLAWAVLQPLALMAIYTVIFSVVTHMPSDGAPYSIFVFSALLPWTFFSGAVTSSTNGLVSHTQLITKVFFPREILPVTYIVATLFDMFTGMIVLAAMMFFYHVGVTALAFWLIPVLFIAVAFATALSLVLSVLQVRFRDIGLAMPLLMQLWMFASPVVYPMSAVPARLRPWYLLNPMAGVVENFRRVLIQHQSPDLDSLRVAAIVTALLVPLAYLIFKQQEANLADVI